MTVTYSGLFYDGPALTLVEQVRKARQLGFDGLSIETKRPVASPLDLTRADRAAVKAAATAEGIALCAIESLSNFASPLMEERENNLAMMRLVIELASDLEVPLVKVFAAWPGLINDEDDDRDLRAVRADQLLHAALSGRPATLAPCGRRPARDRGFRGRTRRHTGPAEPRAAGAEPATRTPWP